MKQHLVMEHANMLLDEGDAQLLGRIDNSVVVLRAGRGGNVFDPRARRSEHIVDERELEFVSSELTVGGRRLTNASEDRATV